MNTQTSHVVTGAFGYSGKYIALRLLEQGHTPTDIAGALITMLRDLRAKMAKKEQVMRSAFSLAIATIYTELNKDNPLV